MIRPLRLSDIRLDFQPSENLDEEKVQSLVVAIVQSETLPPIIARFDGKNYFCYDGFHRIEAYRRAGLNEIMAEVLLGTLEQMEEEFRQYLRELKENLAK
jgi:uncharacterized ParB-like nuclease family protein